MFEVAISLKNISCVSVLNSILPATSKESIIEFLLLHYSLTLMRFYINLKVISITSKAAITISMLQYQKAMCT